MALTTTQLQALRAYILADATMLDLVQTGQYPPVANLLNHPATPTHTVWKTAVSIDEIMRNGMDWARVDNLSVGKARIWDWLGRLGSFDASKANVRAGIDAAWVGTAADLAVRAAVYVHCKRSASLFEQILATGVGTDVSPSTMGAEGPVTAADVGDALSA